MTALIQDEVLAFHAWPSNAELIADCARLGYLRPEWRTLDCTYGFGTFWKAWRPDHLTGCDLIPEKSPLGESVDFRFLPWPDRYFDAVVFDPPYKLNGTPTDEVDGRYGVHVATTREERMALIRDGLTECARVLGAGYLLMKCQDQVNGGRVRWQTIEFTNHAQTLGLELVDRFDMLGHRAQPPGRRQVHARRNSSTLLVFQRETQGRSRSEAQGALDLGTTDEPNGVETRARTF